MIFVIVHFFGGNYLKTSFNGTEADAREYYPVGLRLNIGRGECDHYETIKSVEVIQ